MDQPGAVCRRERVEESQGAAQRRLGVEGSPRAEVLTQGGRVEQLHHDGLAAPVAARVVDAHDSGVVQPRRGDGLLAEAADEGVVVGQVGVQDLDGDPSSEDGVGALPDLGHAAGPDEVVEPVAAAQD